MAFRLLYHPSVTSDDTRKLHPVERSRVHAALRERVAAGRARHGEPLGGSLRGLWAFRIGGYRVTNSIAEDTVRVLMISHGREAYRDVVRRLHR